MAEINILRTGEDALDFQDLGDAFSESEIQAFGGLRNWDFPFSSGAFLLAVPLRNWHSTLTDSADPEGYLRQRLQAFGERFTALGNLYWTMGH